MSSHSFRSLAGNCQTLRTLSDFGLLHSIFLRYPFTLYEQIETSWIDGPARDTNLTDQSRFFHLQPDFCPSLTSSIYSFWLSAKIVCWIAVYVIRKVKRDCRTEKVCILNNCHTRLKLGFWIQAVLWWEPEWVLKSDLTNRLLDLFFHCCAVSPPQLFSKFVRCPHPSLNFWPDNLNGNVRCPPLLLLKHPRILCGVPPYFEHLTICSNLECAVSPPHLILKHLILSV